MIVLLTTYSHFVFMVRSSKFDSWRYIMIRKFLKSLGKNQAGVTAIEYGLIAAIMAVALVAFMPTLTSALSTAFGNISTHLTTP